ncbi:MAG: cell division protein FtsZ, partial [Bacteroidales bacterium]|nr:cell division protein FtsZ [Bacteroidales bacterium]MDD4703535.1 cell division protein FtsZ [Bacteroidales bacterium]
MLQFEAPKENSKYIKVIGVGGGGTNAINHMYNKGIEGVDFIVCNTDQKSLDSSPVQNKIKIGKDGLGAGNCPEKARASALLAEEEIKQMLSNNTQMLFIAAGMGGGTGTGAAPIIAKFAKEIEFTNEQGEKINDEILVVAIVTLPLSFEGKRRKEQAEEGIRNLKEVVDAIIIVNTDKIRERGNIPLPKMFPMADDVLLRAAKGIAELITSNAYVMVDFRDVQSVMSNSGVALMGTGTAYGEGEERALEAIRLAATSDLLNDCEIKGTKNMLLYITTSPEEQFSITVDEVDAMTDYLHSQTENEPDIIWGLKYDESYQDRIDITLVATGFEEKEIYNPYQRDVIQKKKTLLSNQTFEQVDNTNISKLDQIKATEAFIKQPYIITAEEKTQEETIVQTQGSTRYSLDVYPETIIEKMEIKDKEVIDHKAHVDNNVLGIELKQQTEIDVEVEQQNNDFSNENPTNLDQGFDIRKLHKETQSTNPHYTDNHSKIMEDRQRRMERFSQLMKDKNGLDEVLRTPA